MNTPKTPSRLVKAVSLFFFEEHGESAIAYGNSMAPFIRDSQTIAIEREFGQLRRGVCYLFYFENQLILHRLVHVFNNSAVFMGDNSDTVEKIALTSIVGQLRYCQPAMLGIVFTIINQVYYILNQRFGSRLLCRIRKRLIKAALFLFAGKVP